MEVIYIHARPHGHPTHQKYANSVATKSIFYDYLLRWHDIPSGKLKKILSWFFCAIFFSNKKKFDVFYSDGVTYFPVIMKKLGMINKKKQKLISLQADETIYFLKNNLYSTFSQKLLSWALKSYDGIICIGQQQAMLAKDVLGEKSDTKITVIYNGVATSRIDYLKAKKPKLNNRKVLFVANIHSRTRAYYKGLDILLETFSIVCEKFIDSELHIVGNVNLDILQEYLVELNIPASQIKTLGFVKKIDDLYEDYSLYVHLARGEVWGLAIAEAALSGLPILISNETGVKEIISDGKIYTTEIHPQKAANKICDYFSLEQHEKFQRANYLREMFSTYSEENAVLNFHERFNELYNSLIAQ